MATQNDIVIIRTLFDFVIISISYVYVLCYVMYYVMLPFFQLMMYYFWAQ